MTTKPVPKVPIAVTDIKEQRRRARRIEQAVEAMRPYVVRSLMAPGSAWLTLSSADAVREATRKFFYGYIGYKNEELAKIKRLTKAEMVVAVSRVVRDAREQSEIVQILVKKKDHREQVTDKAERKPKRRPRMFLPLAPPALTARHRKAR